jgi:hypothetical protein
MQEAIDGQIDLQQRHLATIIFAAFLSPIVKNL